MQYAQKGDESRKNPTLLVEKEGMKPSFSWGMIGTKGERQSEC